MGGSMTRIYRITSTIVAIVLVVIMALSIAFDVNAKTDGNIYGYDNLGICNVSEGNLNIREVPSTDGKLVGKLPAYAACEIISTSGEWSLIESGDVQGYILSEYLLTGKDAWDKALESAKYIATSNTGGLRVRALNNTDCPIVYQMADGESLPIVENTQDDEWIKVKVCGGVYGYVYYEYVDVDYTVDTAITIELSRNRELAKSLK